MSAISGLIKVTKKGATAPAKAPPFYSAVDEVAQGLSRNKGTGKEFLREIEKTKGVKPAEIKDRKLDKILNTDQKMTKDDLVKVLEDNPPKQITEDIMGEPTQKMIDQKIEELIEKEVRDDLGPRPKYGYEREDWLEDYDRLIEQKSYRLNDYYDEAKEAIKQEGTWGSSKYDRPDWKLAGGENYREIVLKLPPTKSANQQRIMELEAYERRGATNKDMHDELVQLRASRDAAPDEYQSKHWDQPNVLAHMRVQDRVGPNGEKVLHVEEIQSDWHQTGRDKGYADPEIINAYSEYEKALPNRALNKITEMFIEEGVTPDRAKVLAEKQLANILKMSKEEHVGPHNMASILDEQDKLKKLWDVAQAERKKIPEAPFKKNWHELAMKRLINYASENGYDKIAITPGAEQAKRYDLSKQVDSISWEKDANGKITFTPEKNGASLTAPQTVDPQELSSHLGKDVAEKILKSQEDGGFLEGLDLKVGGKGMVGFYDQILPAYLNKYGEKYGAKVGQLPISHGEKMIPDNAGLGMIRSGEPEFTQLHSFDITPQMREEVLTKGQPLYQQIGIPAATGAAGAGMLEDEPAFNRSEKVNITDNPDAMFLELNDQHFGVGGAAKKAVKALKGTQKVLPAAEREANLAKMLEDSAIKDRLYHGTNDDFRSFSNNKLGRNTDGNASSEGYAQTARVGHWFNTKPMGQSPEKYGAGYKVDMPVYLSIKNPKREMSLDWLAQGLESKKGMAYRRELEKQGYDGVVLPDEEFGAQSWVAFRPEQIKSAIGNRGTYDTTKPDINEAQGGLATLKRK